LLKNDSVRLIEADLTTEDAFANLSQDYDYILHFAAMVGVKNVTSSPYKVLDLNFEMLKNCIAFAHKQANLKRFLFLSTSEVYAGTVKYFAAEIPTPETTPLTVTQVDNPRSSYMLSKIYGEAMLHASGLPITIVRPHNIYGPRMGMAHVIPELLYKADSLDNGDSLPVFSPDHTRVFCYIDDAVDFLWKVIDQQASIGKTINMGATDVEISMRDLANLIQKTVGKRLVIKGTEDTIGSPTRRAPSMTYASNLIGYQSRTSLQDGLSKTYRWYKDNVFCAGGVSAS
jgi:nucleoside-diphosphate-sugar epimerase